VASSSSSSPLPPLPSYGPFIIQKTSFLWPFYHPKNFLPMAFLSSKKTSFLWPFYHPKLPSYGLFIIQKNFLPMAFLSSKKTSFLWPFYHPRN
jgi:hypothetical protein